ncbi:T9SS type A sorting domain-containing protein [Lacinutrix sp. Bg11-31]|uniref:T9SS type A sorting domain-containing protein n=1 Tax=Lacinutrix sp. Bg11-31 TaxID=2057808 RepID=UPI000C3015F1|nr:T9SS type A sorting domain-containing protein [Lacinutrix sp. Bg11-31]AUC82624.1 hypothetical protein CW733_10995 [Lacinutrix sp. Bg11-31]
MKKNYITITLFSCFLILSSLILEAQNINFTIDTAVDNGVSITETLTVGPDTYVLQIDVAGTGAETIVPLSGTDLIFYLGSTTPANTFIITLTKNGNPTNFKLNGMDYDTLEDGFISLVNQDDLVISSNQEYLVGAGAVNIDNATNASNITAFKILQPDVNDNTDFAFHNIELDVLDTLGVEAFLSLDNQVAIYPNPSNGNITIKNSGATLNEVTVTDINGRTIEAINLNGITTDKNLDLSSKLSSGLYFVSIVSETGTITKKLIIE